MQLYFFSVMLHKTFKPMLELKKIKNIFKYFDNKKYNINFVPLFFVRYFKN